MRHYQLMAQNLLKQSGMKSVHTQRQIIQKQIKAKHFKKKTEDLEKALNGFFYDKDNRDENYAQAISMAKQEYEDTWSNFQFEEETLSASFKDKQVHFVRNNDSLQEIKAIAEALKSVFQGTKREEEVRALVARVNRLRSKNSKNWKLTSQNLNALVAMALYGNKRAYGDAFEIALTAFAKYLQQSADGEVVEILKPLVAQERSATIVDLSKLSPKDRKQFTPAGTVHMDDGLTLQYSLETQNKVDVILQMKDIFNISAKSYYSIYSQVHILGGTALTTPLLNMGTADFVSAYLSTLYYGENLKDYHTTLKTMILLSALSGAGTGQTKLADVVVLNNRQKKRIYVRNIADIIAACASEDQFKKGVHFTSGSTEIPDHQARDYYQQKKGQNAELTIPSMLNLLSQAKLSVSIKGTIIRDAGEKK